MSDERGAMDELEDRLRGAYETLSDMAEEYTGGIERARLLGKADGVSLALSYLQEHKRMPA